MHRHTPPRLEPVPRRAKALDHLVPFLRVVLTLRKELGRRSDALRVAPEGALDLERASRMKLSALKDAGTHSHTKVRLDARRRCRGCATAFKALARQLDQRTDLVEVSEAFKQLV